MHMSDQGVITAKSQGEGSAGNITLDISGHVRMHKNSLIETHARKADGGDIAITSPGYLYLHESEITTSVNGSMGNGGSMRLEPAFIILDNSLITANAFEGNAGEIDISTNSIYNFSGEPVRKVITAKSHYGLDGKITINSPEGNTLSVIPIAVPKAKKHTDMRPPCLLFVDIKQYTCTAGGWRQLVLSSQIINSLVRLLAYLSQEVCGSCAAFASRELFHTWRATSTTAR
ncbi:MAG: S-layer family protein, partial [Gammaproteobacteria bacterium]|nr:S-layer family protein [Gammaproteobacteria bacterium]